MGLPCRGLLLILLIENNVFISTVQYRKNGPLLFIIYASEMFSIIENHLTDSHGHADDTQLCCSLNPNCVNDQEVAVQGMENCISNLRDWANGSKLKMNDSKTEYTTTIGQIILQSYCSW